MTLAICHTSDELTAMFVLGIVVGALLGVVLTFGCGIALGARMQRRRTMRGQR